MGSKYRFTLCLIAKKPKILHFYTHYDCLFTMLLTVLTLNEILRWINLGGEWPSSCNVSLYELGLLGLKKHTPSLASVVEAAANLRILNNKCIPQLSLSYGRGPEKLCPATQQWLLGQISMIHLNTHYGSYQICRILL